MKEKNKVMQEEMKQKETRSERESRRQVMHLQYI